MPSQIPSKPVRAMAAVGQQDSVVGRQGRYYSRGERNGEHSDTGDEPQFTGRQPEIRGDLWQAVAVNGPPDDSRKYCREAVTDPAS